MVNGPDGKADLLAALRDIHAAAEPGWWPPAPGWWVLAAGAGVLLFLLGRRVRRAWVVRRRRRRYLDALAGIERETDPDRTPALYLERMNRLFRAVAVRAFPGGEAARLQGDEWVRFLREHLPDSGRHAALDVLATGPYRPRPDFDAAGLQAAARTWIAAHG